MQDVDQNNDTKSPKDVKTDEVGKSSLTPPSGSPVMEKDQVLAALHQQNFMDLSGSDEEEASEVESFFLEQDELEDGEPVLDTSQFLLSPENIEGTDLRNVDPETQARLEALLEAAGIGKLATADGKALADPEVLRRLTSSVSCALDEAAAALTRMRAEQQGQLAQGENNRSLAEACSDGDIGTVRKLLDEGRSVHETTEEGESLLSLACSAGYYELAQVLLAMRANVEDRGIKGDCTPLMEAASGGYVDIVKLLISHEADVNAQSSAGNTPLHYAACGGYADVVKVLIDAGANVEEHNENGHTPLMEAASAGHVEVAKILLEAGAGINTHSNEFKESALTLACYKGHLEMVKFLLEAGADQEHKTDEMHTALMEASMDGHVEVARLLLDSGAQVNMPADSFESPLTLAACGGHVELANLLIERGANLEEVNDEGYTPLMEAAREGHEEMVALLLAHGADINAQTDETQETALTLACCGGFLEVADFLIKASAQIELGCSTPLMEAAQEGHLDLVKYLLKASANVRAQTGTGDTALTYACENGHTDVADVLLQHSADLEHESEGGRTPLMKAARAGHLCTVQFLISKGADVNRQTTNNDHTVLSLACAGGHLAVVELLLSHGADPTHKLKDGSTMLIEAAKGGHTQVVNLLLDYPNSILSSSSDLTQQASTDNSHVHMNELPRVPMQGLNNIVPPQDPDQIPASSSKNQDQGTPQSPGQVNLKDLNIPTRTQDQIRQNMQKSLSRSAPTVKQKEVESRSKSESLSSETEPDFGEEYEKGYTEDGGGNTQSALDFDIKAEMKTSEKCEKLEAFIKNMMRKADMLNTTREEQIVKKQQILEQLQIVERELHEKAQEQMILSAQQHSMSEGVHQGQGDGQSIESTSPGKTNINEGKPDNVNYSVDMEGVANGLSVIDRLIDSIVIDLDVPSKLGVSGSLPGSEAGSDIFTDADEKMAHLLAKQESTGSLDSVEGLSTASSTNQTPVTASEGGDIDEASATSTDAKEDQEEIRAPLENIDNKEASPEIEEGDDDEEEEEDEEEDDEEEDVEDDDDDACPEVDEDDDEEEDDEEDEEEDEEECEDQEVEELGKDVVSGEERSSRASSEEVDLSNVVPAGDKVEHPEASNQQQEIQQPQNQQPMQDQLAVARAMLDSQAAALALAGQMVPVSGLDQQTLQQLQTLPIHTVLEQSVAAATSTAAALDQQHQQLQQQRQQLQAQLALQQKLQAELHQQLKLQQEHQQLQQQQLKAQQALTQQMELQQLTKHPKFQAQLKGQASVKLQQQLPQTPGALAGNVQQPVVNLQQLHAQVAKFQPQLANVAAIQAQSVEQEPELDVQKLQQVQNSLQQQLNQVSRQVQQLQVRQQLTQQELLAQAQQLQQELQQAQQLQQLAQQKHVTQQLTQQDLLQQAQQLQQQLQQAQQLQQLAQQQKQLTHYQGSQKKSKKKNTCAVAPEQLNRVLPANHTLTYGNHVPSLPGTSQEAITPPPSTPLTPNPSPASPQYCPPIYPSVDLDAQTESNHDTALTLACAGGHVELVSLLLSRGADIEHRDKKGFTPLILAATAGHADVVEMLLDHGADIEAQSERTKDTPLSLACSGGRYEVVELLLARGANKEHRNVSDYTPLSLAASGGYVNIIKLLLSHGAEINSRTGSKLGISPLMLAAMNGHTAAVKLLLDMGSDINAQIETNRNTALTLACFQGRHEVVSLLVDRKANIEHRAKTGLTPLMEAASGGYVEVGRVLLDKGADVNAPPVPSSRDTALTIAADKGHYRFVELLLSRNAAVDVKNKKGNSPLWLACNGGHLDVVQLLVNARADIDSQDNRKVSCLIAAFRKGHVKVVKWMVKHVTQFPSDQECMRYISTITDKELLKKCHQCMEIIVSAKDRQAAEANRHASILLEQLDREKSLEESKKAAAARKREKKRRKKKEKQEQAQREQEKEHVTIKPKESVKQKAESKTSTPEPIGDKKDDDDDDENDDDDKDMFMQPPSASSSSTTGLPLLSESNKNQRHKRSRNNEISSNSSSSSESNGKTKSKKSRKAERERERLQEQEKENEREKERQLHHEEDQRVPDMRVPATPNTTTTSYQLSSSSHNTRKKRQEISNERHGIGDLDDFGVPSNVKASTKEKERNRKNADKSSKVSSLDTFGLLSPGKTGGKPSSVPSPKKNQKKEEGWKEVTRKTFSTRSKKVTVPSNAISRVIGRGGCNINAIREASGAHIDVDKQKGSGDRVINIKGSTEATRQAHALISALIKDPDKDLDQLLPKHRQKTLSVSQNNNNNTSFLATASTTAASSSAHMFTTSVWHNSMANHITCASIVPVSSIATSLQQSKGMSTKVTNVGSTRVSASTSSIVSQMQAPFANVVRQSQSVILRPGVPLAPPGVLQNGPVSHLSPKRIHVTIAGVLPSSPKSPGSVARQLFPGGDKSTNISTIKTSVTYSTVSMAKTKVVTATTPTFASKVDSSSRPVSSSKLQQKSTSASPAPSSKQNQVVPSSGKTSSEPQPLPIKSSNITSTRRIPSQQTSTGRPLAPVGPTEYSPFNNLFSQELEMLNKKEEGMDRKDFASVAAAGVIPSSSSVMSSVSPAPIDSHPDPSLPAKAPGYKHPGQRTSSPQINEHDHRSKVQGYVGLSHQHQHQAPSPHNPQMLDHVGMENLVSVGPTNFAHHASSQQTNLGEADPSKAPGFKGFPDHQEPHSRTPGFRTHVPISHPNMSPRTASMVGPHGGFSTLLQSHPRNEYSTPDQPMTLPKIESTLNPNAPDFTSRAFEASNRFPPMPGMGGIGPGFGSGFNSLSNIAALAGLSNLQSTLGPALGMGNQGAYRVPPPPVGNVMNQGGVGNIMPGNEFLAPDLSNANGQVFTRFAHATLISSGAMNVPSNMSRPFKPMPPTGPSAATTPPAGASKRESPVPTVASEPSPSSTSAPSPTDHSGMMESFNRQLRPIGTERAQKKPHAPGYSTMGEAGAAGLWAYNTDLSADWMSLTTSVVTSAVITPGSAEGEEQRPASHPAMSPRMRPPSYPTPDSHLDPAVDAQYGQAAVLIANSGGPAVIAANGVPAGAAAALPMAHVYTQAPMAAETLPSMWNQQVKPEPAGQEPKMMWNNNWNNPQSM